MDGVQPGGSLPASSEGLLGDGGLLAELERWAADARVQEAALRRARERWLRQQAGEESSVAGILTDLAERGTTVVVATRSGRRHQGAVHGLGADFVTVRGQGRSGTLIRLDAVETVRTLPAVPSVTGDRAINLSVRLSDVLLGVSADRPTVLIVTNSDETARGELRAIGTDVVTIRGDGQPPATIYVPIDAIAEVTTE